MSMSRISMLLACSTFAMSGVMFGPADKSGGGGGTVARDFEAELKAMQAERDAARGEVANLTDALNKADETLDELSREADAAKAEAKAATEAAAKAAPFVDTKISNAKADPVTDVEMYATERGYYGGRIIAAGEKFVFSGVPGMWMIPVADPKSAEAVADAKARNASAYQGAAKAI